VRGCDADVLLIRAIAKNVKIAAPMRLYSYLAGQPWCVTCQQRRARCTGCGHVRAIRSGTLSEPLLSLVRSMRPNCGQTMTVAMT